MEALLKSTVHVKTEIANESQDTIELGVQTYTKKKTNMYAIIFIVIIAVCVVLAITFSQINNTKQKENQQEAFDTLQHLMEDEPFDSNDDKYQFFETAFETFDANNDGFLNEREFSNYFLMQLNYSKAFEVMDVDKDNILSYPEIVVYEQKLNEISPIKKNTLSTMVNAVKMKYGFEYSPQNTADFGTFLQYAVILQYFEPFDTNKNGYITHEEFLRIAAQQEFVAYDLDENGEISRDAFFDILYGTDEKSWKGKLRAMFGDSYRETMNKVGSINITPDMVKNVQITLSPIQILRQDNHNAKQEQQQEQQSCKKWETITVWVYNSSCDCHKMEFKVICVLN